MSNELLYQIAITKILKIGNVLAKQLISYCGGVEAVFKASKKALLKIPGIGELLAQNIITQQTLSAAEKKLNLLNDMLFNLSFIWTIIIQVD